MIVTAYTPRRHFKAFHARGARWSVLVCHRRAGKTVAAINDLIARASMTPKTHAQYAYIAPFREQAKRVAFSYLLRYTIGLRVDQSIAELSVTLFNGSKIYLFGADNPDALRGMYLDGVIIDEPAMMRARVFAEIIRPLLADRRGWAVWIGTPAGKNEFWRIREEARLHPGTWFLLTLPASQSGILPQSELDDAMRLMDEDEYAQEFECSFEAALKGSYYGRLLNQMGERIGDVPHDPSLPVHCALDLGYTDTTACWAWQALGDEVRYIWSYQESGLAIADHVDILRSRHYVWGDIWLPRDARAKSLQTGKSLIEILVSQHNIRPLIVPDMSVQQGIQASRLMLTHCWIDAEGCEVGLEMLRQYQREYDDQNRCFKQNPKHDLASNLADGFRYSALVAHKGARDAVNRITPLNWKPDYNPLLPYGGNVQLNEIWDTAPQAYAAVNERI